MLKVLFVEDDQFLRHEMAKKIRAAGYDVTEAQDGQHAFEIIKDIQTPWFALVTDYNMPNMSGGELISNVRRMGKPFQVMVLASAVISTFQEVQGLKQNGELEVLEKPFAPNSLIELLNQLKNRICK